LKPIALVPFNYSYVATHVKLRAMFNVYTILSECLRSARNQG